MNEETAAQKPGGEVVVYEAKDGDIRVDVRLANETVWLSLKQMAELFGLGQVGHLPTPQEGLRQRGARARGSCCRKCNNCLGRQGLSGHQLQPRRHLVRGLPGQLDPRYAIPQVGDQDASRSPGPRLYAQREAATRPWRGVRAGRLPAFLDAAEPAADHRRGPGRPRGRPALRSFVAVPPRLRRGSALGSARADGRSGRRGINLHPGQFGTPDFIEFDSVINIRPSQGNRTRSVDDPAARARVTSVVNRLVAE